jgi:hypothetical protein
MLPTKYRRELFILLLTLFCFNNLVAQQRFTISGTIREKLTGETMIGVSVNSLETKERNYTASNEYGFYSLTLPRGSYKIIYSFIGYNSDTLNVNLDSNKKIDVEMSERIFEIREAVVRAERRDDNIRRAEIGLERVDIKETARIPVLFGERDILKTIQLLPGIKSAGEGSSGFYVRGGTEDQNLILLDEAPVYNASHLLGFFSTFNSDALKDATIIKGNPPAQYGGRLSSVLDIKMKEGNSHKYTATGGIGLISSRLSIEGPIVEDKSSFIVSGRRTYADLFLKLTQKYKDNKLYFYDLNAKVNFKIDDRNRVFASGYFGRDVLGLGDDFGIDWGNKTGTVRWNSILGPKLFSNTSLIYSDYNYQISIGGGNSKFNINSEIIDWSIKEEFQYFPNSKNSIRFGLSAIYHNISPSRFEGDGISVNEKRSRLSLESAFFANNTMKISDILILDYGMRLSSYTILGGDTYNIYSDGELINSISIPSGKFGKSYINLEPRLQFSFMTDRSSSIKVGFARNTQNLHLLSNSISTSPTDQWIGNSYNIKPETSDQYSIGYFRNFLEDKYQFSIESYYKKLNNQIDFKNGADIGSVPDIESELLYGEGRAYGVEFLIKKTTGVLTGWLGYTLSKTERKIDGINRSNWYPAKQDRTHDLTMVAMYQLTKSWYLTGLFVYYTGNAVTFPSGKYRVDNSVVFYYTERNGYRMPSYHRLDLGATYTKQHKGRYESSWNFSLYNAYGRENAYVITFEEDQNDPSRTIAVQTSLFRWIPSFTYNFKF